MDRTLFEQDLKSIFDKNFEKYSEYFSYEFKIFFELRTTTFEITKCLILTLDKAVITLTNHLLERLLKLALINDEIGLGTVPVEKWDSVFGDANAKFGSKNLSSSIDLCKKHDLITEAEKDFLHNYVRELMRNGFSHGDSSKILVSVPDKSIGLMGCLDEPLELKQFEFSQKLFPALQSALIDDFAKLNAPFYFKFVFDLIAKIENKLIEKG